MTLDVVKISDESTRLFNWNLIFNAKNYATKLKIQSSFKISWLNKNGINSTLKRSRRDAIIKNCNYFRWKKVSFYANHHSSEIKRNSKPFLLSIKFDHTLLFFSSIFIKVSEVNAKVQIEKLIASNWIDWWWSRRSY